MKHEHYGNFIVAYFRTESRSGAQTKPVSLAGGFTRNLRGVEAVPKVKHSTMELRFCCPPLSGRSGRPTATGVIAPHRTLVQLGIKVGTGWIPVLRQHPLGRQGRAESRHSARSAGGFGHGGRSRYLIISGSWPATLWRFLHDSQRMIVGIFEERHP
jgi:hypothetical protein